MTEPWQIHVCPVHGPRTPTMLGDCPVGCCAEVMEVVRVVRDTRGDGLGLIEHGKAFEAEFAAILNVAYKKDGSKDFAEFTSAFCAGWIACRERHAGAVSDAETGRALIDRMFELPRGPEWEQALAELRVWSMKDHNPRGQSTAEEAFEQSSGGETLEEAQARQFRGEHAFSPQPDTSGATDENENTDAT
jgi:hypothetical protein